ncbi:MAG TPA: heparinase II/III-family protein, partial [Pyrinomonadaceae bacterium]
AHNTLTVDGESSSVPGGPFSWKSVAEARAREWRTHARFDFFGGEHDGFARLPSPATHIRSILFLKGDYWVMRDRVETEGPHSYELHFHFAPESAPAMDENAVRERVEGSPGLELFSFGGGDWREEEGWVSRCYAGRSPAPVYTFSASAEGACEFVTFLVPRRAGEPKVTIKERACARGRAFELRDGDMHDLVLLGDGGLIKTERVETDFSWAWARFTAGGTLPEELVLIHGSRLVLDGRELVSAPERVAYVVARREGDVLSVEADGQLSTLPLQAQDFRFAV